MIRTFTPELIEEIEKNLEKMFWEPFNQFKEWIMMYIIKEETESRIQSLIYFAILVGIFLAIKSLFAKFKEWRIKQMRRKKKGYKNFKGDTWYPDGTVWNAQKEEWEEADYNNK